MQQAVEKSKIKQNKYFLSEKYFEKCISKSIDYAVMEKTTEGCVLPLNTKWSDIGTWEELWNISKKDLKHNYIEGDIVTENVQNSYIKSDNKLVAVSDFNDILIVNTRDSLLVCKKGSSQNIKKIVNKLKITEKKSNIIILNIIKILIRRLYLQIIQK